MIVKSHNDVSGSITYKNITAIPIGPAIVPPPTPATLSSRQTSFEVIVNTYSSDVLSSPSVVILESSKVASHIRFIFVILCMYG